jgi:hypothetical protein
MMHTMHKSACCILLTTMALAISGARADEYALNRFKGGSADGYAMSGWMRDISVAASSIRFNGGTADGYDLLSLLGLRMPQRGLMIRVY